MDSSRVLNRLGAGRGVFWTAGRSAGPLARVESHGADLRDLHRLVLPCPNLVAPADLPLPRRAGNRRRMGGRLDVACGDLAEAVAAVDGSGASNRREYWRARRVPRRSAAGRGIGRAAGRERV